MDMPSAMPIELHRYLHSLTALHFAALFNRIDHAAALLEHGADKNAIGLRGELAFGAITI